MKRWNLSRRDTAELTVLLTTYAAVTIVALCNPLRIEWIWRVPQVILPFVLVAARRESIKTLGLTAKNILANLKLGIVVAALLTVGLAPLYLGLWPAKMPSDLYLDVWFWIIIFSAVNGIVIELFYRGCLQPKLAAVTGATPAIVGTALLCGLDLFEFMVFGPVVVVIAALAFGALYHRTGSLVAPVTAHILWFLLTAAVVASV